jgi:hypothetical protein
VTIISLRGRADNSVAIFIFVVVAAATITQNPFRDQWL